MSRDGVSRAIARIGASVRPREVSADIARSAPAHSLARARKWPADPAPKRFRGPDAVGVVKGLIWCMRDRGLESPEDLRGVTREELEDAALARKAKRSSFATFDDALDAAIAAGWIETYQAIDGELRYLPNYRRDAG